MVNYFQHPYQKDPEALGVPIILEDATKNVPGRAPVKDVYAQIISDLTGANSAANPRIAALIIL